MSKVIFDQDIRHRAEEKGNALFAAAYEGVSGEKIETFSFGMSTTDAARAIHFCLRVGRGDNPQKAFDIVYKKKSASVVPKKKSAAVKKK